MAAAQLPREILNIIFEDLDYRRYLLACTKTCRSWSVPASEQLHRVEHRRAVNWAIVKKDNALLDRVLHIKSACFALEDLTLAIMMDNAYAAEAMLSNDALLLEWREGHLRERERPADSFSWERQRRYRERDVYGAVPLVAAVVRRNKQLVARILEAAPDINHDVPDRLSHTPLTVACASEQQFIDKVASGYLSANHASVMWYATPGQNLLARIDTAPDLDIVRLLVEAGHRLDPPSRIELCTSGWRNGAQVEVETQQSCSRQLPLYLASCAGNIPLMELLLSLGAAPDGQGTWDTNDLRPLMGAASVPGNVEAVRVLLKGGADPLQAGFRVVGSPLHAAADTEIAAELLDAGVPVDYCSAVWREAPCVTPLAHAIYARRPEVALLLLSKGANASCTDYLRCPVIRTAVYRNVPEVIPALVARGENPYGGKSDTHSPWCLRERAVIMNSVAVVEQMLALGMDFERRMPRPWLDLEGRPRDHRPICWVRSVEMLDLIAGCSGDLNERVGDNGETVFLQAMRSRGTASEEERRAIVKRFVELGADINAVDNKGQTVLHKAVRFSDEVTADELIRRGQDINKPDIAGWTPLMLACKRGHPPMVKMLMEYGADIHATLVADDRWKEGAVETALDMALERLFTWGVKRLLEAGADPVPARNYPSHSVRRMIRWKLPALGYCLDEIKRVAQ